MRRSVLAIFFLLSACPDARPDERIFAAETDGASMDLSFGAAQLKAHEIVYDGQRILSRLNWRSSFVPLFNATVEAPLPENFYMRLSGSVASGGKSHMADYDWLSTSPQWTDRSLHPDTKLDHYFSASMEIGRSLLSSDDSDFRLGAGFLYSDIQWTARGGSYIYSYGGFRDTFGEFDPDQKGITFRQRWPVPYLAANIEHENGNWHLSSGLRAGVTLNASGTDDHWQTSYRFRDDYFAAPYLSASLAGEYRLGDKLSLYMKGSAERMFRARADVTETSLTTGKQNRENNTTGGDFQSMSIIIGLRGKF